MKADLCKRLGLDNVVTLDFETYYDRNYSLSKMTTTSYVRDPRFKTHCLSLKELNSKNVFTAPEHEVKDLLAEYDWSRTAVICHHTLFDGFVLSQQYDVVPKFYFDTLSMARALHAHETRLNLDTLGQFLRLGGKKFADSLVDVKGVRNLTPEQYARLSLYCANDTVLTEKIFKKLIKKIPHLEQELIDVTIRSFCDPVLVLNTARVQRVIEQEKKQKADVLDAVDEILKTDSHEASRKILASNPQFAAKLEELGYDVPMKISPMTGKLTFALAKNDLDFQAMADADPIMRALYDARLQIKSRINETRGERLLEHGKSPYRLPVPLNYCAAHTHRWGGTDSINFQNFPRNGELQQSLAAPPGFVILVIDSAQIEARMAAWLAGDKELLEQFRLKMDSYCILASKIYGHTVTKKDELKRFVGKTATLGLQYSMGGPRFKLTLAQGATGPKVLIDLEEANKIVRIYRNERKPIVDLWAYLGNKLYTMSFPQNKAVEYKGLVFRHERIDTPSGLSLHYPGLKATPDEQFGGMQFSYHGGKIYGGKLLENITQKLARDVVAYQIAIIARKYRVIMTRHDEGAFLVRKEEAEDAMAFALETFRTPPAWCRDLPVDAEAVYAQRYTKP